MKHSILFAALGLCSLSVGCGGAPGESSDGSGATWSPAREVGDDDVADDPESNVVAVTDDLSYSNWSLQLPTGSDGNVTTLSSSSLSNGSTKSPYFYKASDGGMIFMDPQKGFATSGSQHPRTEMHENATWGSSGTNTMTVSLKLNKVGNSGNVAIGQIFQNGEGTLAELQYNGSGHLKLFYEENKGGSSSTQDLGVSVAVGTKFTYQMGFSGKKLTIQINGKQVYSKTPGSTVQSRKFYFKYGTYDQTATKITSGSPTTSVYTQADVYSVSVTHK